MDLKDFIKETITAIIQSTSELQRDFEAVGALVNPPIFSKEGSVYDHDNENYTRRRVEVVEFDVAVTAESEIKGGAKAALRVFSLDASVDGGAGKRSENVSRVRFSIPIVLPPSEVEKSNRTKAAESRERSRQREMNRDNNSSF